MILNKSAAPYGDEAIAAMSIVARVIGLLFCVGLGIGQGFQPVAVDLDEVAAIVGVGVALAQRSAEDIGKVERILLDILDGVIVFLYS